MLKLLIHQETEAILGVHIIGTSATELVHIGQAVMGLKGTAEYFIDHGVQLSDPRRVLQGRRLQRSQQDPLRLTRRAAGAASPLLRRRTAFDLARPVRSVAYSRRCSRGPGRAARRRSACDS